MRAVTLAVVLLAGVAVPKGHKATHPKATHLTIVETTVDAGNGVKAQVEAGVPVAAPGVRGAPSGKQKITLAGGVELEGTIDGIALGLVAAKDTPLLSADGKQTVGTAREGAPFLVVAGKAKAGFTLVEGAAPFGIRGQIATDALTAEPHELVIAGTWQYVVSSGTDIFASAELSGDRLAQLPMGTRIEFLEQNARAAHVKTNGGVVIEGWVDANGVRKKEKRDLTAPVPSLVKPTHEVFVDAPIYASDTGKKKIGALRGGTLVELDAPAAAAKGDFVKVTTAGPVTVDLFVRRTDLRALEQGLYGGAP